MNRDGLDRFILKIAGGCLLYTVDADTGERRVLTQEEYLAEHDSHPRLIPHTDPHLAAARSAIIQRRRQNVQ